ncbi:MAG: hypothetical protein DHS20C17_19870 [Cyclobacteriaceae bacterium]|nr:MAG: hypothetical protein DHS20C17_19870 [Cyclobacteriaceae bacterium]
MADSAGTSAYHLGESPDARSTENARINGVKVLHKARQFVVEDFNRFDIILAMDYHNLHRIEALAKKHGIVHQGIRLLRSFQNDPETLEVPDPYFGGPEGFQEVFDILDDCNQKLIEYLTAN